MEQITKEQLKNILDKINKESMYTPGSEFGNGYAKGLQVAYYMIENLLNNS